MDTWNLINFLLLLGAAICFILVLADAKRPAVNFLALGFLLWVLVPLLHAIRAL